MGSKQPDPATITSAAFTQLLKFYPAVQDAAYRAKIKDPKKLLVAQNNHDWRYNELPGLIRERSTRSTSAYLEKDEMVRLTQWKIVHGQNRPFLPGMVKKNEQERIKDVTSSAFKIQAATNYNGSALPDSLDKALREAAQLNGVGPATASLVCSIFDPTNVAFFEDELAAWLRPDISKLKYSWAEYKALFTEFTKLRTRLGLEHKAVDVEKVGFVIEHLEMLDEQQRKALSSACNDRGESSAEAKPAEQPKTTVISPDSSDDEPKASARSRNKAAATKRKLKADDDPTTKSRARATAKRTKRE